MKIESNKAYRPSSNEEEEMKIVANIMTMLPSNELRNLCTVLATIYEQNCLYFLQLFPHLLISIHLLTNSSLMQQMHCKIQELWKMC